MPRKTCGKQSARNPSPWHSAWCWLAVTLPGLMQKFEVANPGNSRKKRHWDKSRHWKVRQQGEKANMVAHKISLDGEEMPEVQPESCVETWTWLTCLCQPLWAYTLSPQWLRYKKKVQQKGRWMQERREILFLIVFSVQGNKQTFSGKL